MNKINIEKIRIFLQDFRFKELFIDTLGWSNPKVNKLNDIIIGEDTFSLTPIAELSSALIIEVQSKTGEIPLGKIRQSIENQIKKQLYEHVLIFVDNNRTETIWHWQKVQDKKKITREHTYFKGQPGDLFISKISALIVDISELDENGNISIMEVANRLKKSLDIEIITKKFFKDYQIKFIDFIVFIEGIDDERDRKWYASVILNRLMFIYFLQKKYFIDNANTNYLNDKLEQINPLLFEKNSTKFYNIFLQKLFFEGFALPTEKRTQETNKLIGKIKYLNGGLFLKHKLELKYPNISIKDTAFANIFQLFDSYSWNLNDTPGGNDNEINPDVLGYIFEKYINQKAFGAYYTRTEITEYLCEQTIHKLLLDEINGEKIPDLSNAKYVNDKTKNFFTKKYYDTLEEALFNIDAEGIKKLLLNNNAILTNLSLLDPACGSGAFLIAALKKLIDIYSAVIGKIDFIGNSELKQWKQNILNNHPNIDYYIKKQIITNNLYGVDIMEEAVEIAKLRLFLTLVASAKNIDDLEPLPNIDFNIMYGNSLIGLLNIDEKTFDKKHTRSNLFRKSYADLLREKQQAIYNYQKAEELNIYDKDQILNLRAIVEEKREEAMPILNEMLTDEFKDLGIKYEQVTWDTTKNKEGKPIKRTVTIKDTEKLNPFHWGYEFSKVFNEKGGFDAIITNPPWETFQPNAKEFLQNFSSKISKKKMDIKDFENEFAKLMKNKDIRDVWLEFKSDYSHVREYFRFSNQYINQVPIIDGKRHGKDVNLFKLFLELSYNLLRKKGDCGIVIPSSIYNDLGSKKLRELLFDNSKISGLFCFENRKTIFEGVHKSFKFVILSFKKDYKTKIFPVAFMRQDVSELESFPKNIGIEISVDFIKKQSPESLSIMEIKNPLDYIITNRMLNFPTLSDKSFWHAEFHRELNMTDDAYLFLKENKEKSLRLFEGKMIYNFTNSYAKPRFWIDEKEGRKAYLGRTTDNGQIISYQKYRIAYRAIASSTNERALISTIIPPCFTGNSLNTSENLDYTTQIYLVSFLNSFVLDWLLRQQVTTNINMFYLYQLPVPRLVNSDKWFLPIVERSAKLICTTAEFADLWNEVMPTKWTEQSGVRNETERNQLRAELDGIIAHIYGLTEEEFSYVLSTFPIVKQAQKDLTMNEYKKITT
ncbi:MAG: ATP-binding protein [Bacteroidetes bacterium]|nr:MAG: ATP-binding protein [Bacteroidota bacterium]TAG88703.1 MAG: ATP-binding protein [Bacteroidota bacterium]